GEGRGRGSPRRPTGLAPPFGPRSTKTRRRSAMGPSARRKLEASKNMTNLMLKPRYRFDFDLDPFFRNLFNGVDTALAAPASPEAWYPAMDLVDDTDKLVAHVSIPGMDAKGD